MGLLTGLRLVQLGRGWPPPPAAGCSLILVRSHLCRRRRLAATGKTPELTPTQPHRPRRGRISSCRQGRPDRLRGTSPSAIFRRADHDPDGPAPNLNPGAALVYISPYGQTGPNADDPATDLTLFFSQRHRPHADRAGRRSREPPIRPVGKQSAFIGGLAAACAGMHAALSGQPAIIDVSIRKRWRRWR